MIDWILYRNDLCINTAPEYLCGYDVIPYVISQVQFHFFLLFKAFNPPFLFFIFFKMGSGSSSSSIKNKNLLFQRYKINSFLSQGGYSFVFLGINKITNKQIIIKKINILKVIKINQKVERNNLKKEEEIKQEVEFEGLNSIFNELNSFQRIGNHSFIVTLQSAFRQHSCCYFVLDYLSGGDLRHFLKINGSLNEESVVYIIGCIGSALHHIHNRGVIHRDIKPENICLDSLGRPYLTDFGISLVSSVENPIPIGENSSGTLPYLSPEVLSPTHFHSHQSDYWSLGVLAYELFYNRRPFNRLCPLNFVQFVTNEYEGMWVALQKRVELQLQNNLNYNSGIDSKFDSLVNEKVLKLDPMIDLESIQHSNKDYIVRYPYFNTYLNDDGSVPSCLMVPLPSIPSSIDSQESHLQYSFKIPSEEFKSLLNGLLDVRIPRRLGNMTRYLEFHNHPCFLKYEYFLSQLTMISSPMLKYSNNSTLSLPSISTMISFQEDLNTNNHEKLPTQIERKLADFNYERPTPANSLLSLDLLNKREFTQQSATKYSHQNPYNS